MKTLKKLLLFWMFIPMFSVVLAQPANDNCATATNLGTLPTPSACSGGSGGVGAAVTATGTTNAATAANPYTYLLGCQGGGDQPAPALDVWYSFVASGNEVVINITPNGTSFLANPAITLWRGSCGSLIGQGCKLGTAAGNNSFTFGPTTPGQTYYIQISGNNMTSTGNFNLSVKNNNDCTACNITSNLVATPAPTNGTYPPNTSVTFCYTISNWATTSANWLHGVIPSFGCGWDLTTLTPGTPPAVIGGSGTWKWYNSVTSQATGQTFGKGFYIDKGGDNNPGNNFGDNGTGTWTFCWTIKTKPVSACSGGCKDLSMSINTTGDGESGSWTSLACVNDPDFPFSAMLACCTTTAAGTNPSCGGNDGTATATPVTPSTPPYTYSWNTAPVQTSQTATGLPAGTYTVTVTDNNGCKSTANAVLTSGAMPTVNAGADVTICNGNSTTLTATASTGGGTYTWSPATGLSGTTGATVTASPTSTQTYTVTYTNGPCTATDQVIVTVTSKVTPTFNPIPAFCNGTTAPTLPPTSTNGITGTWSPATVSNTASGTYNFTPSAGQCANTTSISITVTPKVTPTFNPIPAFCNGTTAPTLPPTSTNGISGTWSPATVSNTASGTYNFTPSAGQCANPTSISITVNPLPTPSITPVSPLCVDAAAVTLVGTPSGGTFSGLGVTGTNFNPATAGTGTKTITYNYTDGNGCQGSATTTITVNPTPTFTVASTNPSVCGGTDGSIILSGLTASTSYSVTYNAGATTVGPTNITSNASGTITISGLGAGSYSNFVVSQNGCSTTIAAPQTLVDPSAPTVNAGTDVSICDGNSTTLTATPSLGGGTFTWSPATGLSGTTGATVTASPTATQTYTVTYVRSGCTTTDQVIVTINPLPTPSITAVAPLCEDAAVVSLVGTPSGAGGVFSGAGVSGTNFNPATAGVGTHTITYDYTDANGCFASTTTSITVKPKPIFTVTSTSPTVCAGTDGTVTLNGLTPSTSYSVSYENGATTVGPTTMTSNGAGSIVINGLSSGTYSNFTVDLNGCVTTVATPQVLIDPSAPTVNAGIDQTICSGTSVTLTATNPNGATISWSNGVTDGTAFTPAVGTITYTVTATLAGCITTDQVIVTVNPLPTPSITTVAPLCEDAAVVSLVGTPSGAGGVFSGAGVSGTNFNPATAGVGTHTITYNYTDGNGCFASTTTTITVKPKPVFTVSSSNPTLCLGTDGVVTLSGLTGNTSYSVSYVDDGTTVGPTNITSNAAGNILLTGLNAGTYSNFTVDLNGCITTVATPQVLVDPSAPVVNAGIDQTVCQGTSVTLTATNPNGATISWSNGVTDGTAFTPAVGTITYTVTAILAGCTTTDQVDVTVNPMPNASSIGTTTVCQGAGDQTITFTGQNSSANYTFSYTVNGGTSQTVTSSSSSSATVIQSSAVPGTYIYQLTNVSDPTTGCNQTLNEVETIIVKPLPIASISNPVQACHLDTNLPQVVFTGSNGDTPYTFTYTINGGSNLSATSDASGVFTIQNPTNTVGTFTYTITAIKEGSVNGCQQIQNEQTVITIHALPNVNAGNDQTVCAGTTVILQGAGASTYDWDNGVFNGNSFVPTSTTTYTVIGTDNNGCKNTDQVIVNVVPIPVVNFDGINLNGCNPISPTLFNHSTGNLTNCKWYLGNGQVVDGCTSITATFDSPGCYDVTLEVSTPEGCSNSLTMQDYICVYPQPIAEFHPTHTELTSYQWTSQMVNESLNADTYKWTFDDDTAPSYEFSPVHQFPNESSGVYTIQLIASNSYGCADTTTRQIKMADDLLFFIPNTFTPDGDQHNNVFQPVFSHGFDPYDYTLYIFNRWGEIVFESHDATIGWDGSYGVGGQLCPDGTYTWKIEVKTTANDERKMFTGHVNIIR
ncbi:MAG: gliding motility-associated C-terminal domain-containing protein [Crocinitomicaceae bacterium]|nr:gliding motility-associated C-terminal domain-containing protein [Crocinitomicaceae bacterium]